jgi:hypothetical protein
VYSHRIIPHFVLEDAELLKLIEIALATICMKVNGIGM